MLADGVKQMGFAQADAAIEEQWIVSLARSVSHRLCGGKGHIVVAAHHERVKGILGIEM